MRCWSRCGGRGRRLGGEGLTVSADCVRHVIMKSTIKEILSVDETRKVVIVRRDDGTFGFEALRFSNDPLEICWIPTGRFSECITDSVESAECEARGRVEWLRDESRN